MLLPKQWNHDPYLKDDYGMTVAIYMAIHTKYIPKQWYHDPTI